MTYQNINGVTNIFERDCLQRWEIIKPYLSLEGVCLDVGAAEGYFLKAIAEQTNLLAVGVEMNPDRVRVQHKWLNEKYNGKVISCHSKINEEFITNLNKTPEWFDSVLMLSVLHYINSDIFIRKISSMSGKLFIEIPDLNDMKAAGQNFINKVRKYGSEYEYLKNITLRNIKLIGTVKAHTSPTRNIWMINGDLERKPEIPHIKFYEKSEISYEQYYKNNKLNYMRNKKEIKWIPGVNLATLKEMKITFPSYNWWYNKIRKSIAFLDMKKVKGDLRINNVVCTRNNLKWIDTNHRTHETTIYDDIKDMVCDI